MIRLLIDKALDNRFIVLTAALLLFLGESSRLKPFP